MSAHQTFLRAFLRTPGGIGAVAPSGKGLARQMVASARIDHEHTVVELGAGTGPVTRELADTLHGNPLLVLEPDAALAAHCRTVVPGADIVERFAQDLPELIAERGWSSVDRVVSSLPFAGWPFQLQNDIFDAILEVLSPEGRFVTFTYVMSPFLPAGRRARALLEARFSNVAVSQVVWANLPPAFVYECDVN